MADNTPQDEDFGMELTRDYGRGEAGQIQIGDDVIARIVEIATGEVEGISLESRFALSDLISRKDKESVKGILVERDADSGAVTIHVSVRMAYGKDMYDLAVRVQKHIKQTVEKMTHVAVRKVDIRIVGILVEKEKEKDKDAAARDKLVEKEKEREWTALPDEEQS
jgi:uncharacterized alkaline shock family protein YloU